MIKKRQGLEATPASFNKLAICSLLLSLPLPLLGVFYLAFALLWRFEVQWPGASQPAAAESLLVLLIGLIILLLAPIAALALASTALGQIKQSQQRGLALARAARLLTIIGYGLPTLLIIVSILLHYF